MAAISRLSLGTVAESRAAFEVLLESRQPQPTQSAAVDAVVATGAPEVGEWLLARWATMSPKVRSGAAGALFTREPWVVALLDAIRDGRVPLADFDPAQIRQLAGRTEPAIVERYTVKNLVDDGLPGEDNVKEPMRAIRAAVAALRPAALLLRCASRPSPFAVAASCCCLALARLLLTGVIIRCICLWPGGATHRLLLCSSGSSRFRNRQPPEFNSPDIIMPCHTQ